MIELSEVNASLIVDGDEFFGSDEHEFYVLAWAVEFHRLSDLPRGVTVMPCDPVIGSHELIHRHPYCSLHHTEDGRFIGSAEVPFIPDDPNVEPEAARTYLASALAGGMEALEPLQEDGTLLSTEQSIYEDIAYLTYAVRLHDQKIGDAECFMAALNQRSLDGFDRDLLFICHASEDKPFVERLVDALDRLALHAWFDEREIVVGDSIVERIDAALKRARYLIAVLSPRSIERSWVRRELNSSLMRQLAAEDIRILPVLLESCDIPPLLADIKYADFRDGFEGGFESLLVAIRRNGTRSSAP